MDLISKGKTDVLCIQETMLSNQTSFNLKFHKRLFKKVHTNYQAFLIVAKFIHETIIFQKLTLNPPMQAVSGRINIGRDVTIISKFNSQNLDLSDKLLPILSQQLPELVTLTGDFNIYYQK